MKGMTKGSDSEVWAIACYHEAIADIRWAKERASSVTHWSILLSGAIAIGINAASLSVGIGAVLCVAQVVVALLWLGELNGFAKGARQWVHRVIPLGAYPVKQKDDPDHLRYLGAHILIVVIGAGLAIAAMA